MARVMQLFALLCPAVLARQQSSAASHQKIWPFDQIKAQALESIGTVEQNALEDLESLNLGNSDAAVRLRKKIEQQAALTSTITTTGTTRTTTTTTARMTTTTTTTLPTVKEGAEFSQSWGKSAEPAVADFKMAVMNMERFVTAIGGYCKDHPSQDCKGTMGENLWCAMFVRNMPKFVVAPGKEEERARCRNVTAKSEHSDWLTHSTWQLRGGAVEALVQRDVQGALLQSRGASFLQAGFWPFTAEVTTTTPAPTTTVTTTTAGEKNIAGWKQEVSVQPRFVQTMDKLCEDAPAKDKAKCHEYMDVRLWCAMYSRNMPKFILVDGTKEERVKCAKVNKMNGADWFVHATWPLRGKEFLQMR